MLASLIPASVAGHHVAVLKRRYKSSALLGIVSQPVQQLRKSPLMRIHAAAPLNRFQLLPVCQLRDLLSLDLGPVIAPQVVVIQRLKIRAHRDHARPRRIKRNRADCIAAYAGICDRLARRFYQRVHLVDVRLRRIVRVFTLALQRILRARCAQPPALAVQQRHTHAQRPEIHSRNNRHSGSPGYPKIAIQVSKRFIIDSQQKATGLFRQ